MVKGVNERGKKNGFTSKKFPISLRGSHSTGRKEDGVGTNPRFKRFEKKKDRRESKRPIFQGKSPQLLADIGGEKRRIRGGVSPRRFVALGGLGRKDAGRACL